MGVPGGTGDAVRLYAVAAPPVVGGGGGGDAAAAAAAGAGHLVVVAAGLGVADCLAEAARMSAPGQEWELTAHIKLAESWF